MNSKSRILVSMLGFNTVEMIEGAMQRFCETVDPSPEVVLPVLFDCGYPLPKAEENSAKLIELAPKYGFDYHRIQNISVTENHNVAMFDILNIQDSDYYVTYDPDCRLDKKGWLWAMVEALDSEEDLVFCCAAMRFHDEDWCSRQHGRSIHELPSGLRIAKYTHLIAWPMGTYKGWWLKNYATRKFRAYNEVYGYGEHAMVDIMHREKKRWCTLVDFYDDHKPADEIYCKWKIESACRKTQKRFEDWLKERGHA